nr:ankyrin repeat domain-containing protein 35 [Pogona vitticeps]
MPGGGTLGSPRAGEKAGAAMKKMFSCSSNQVAVETWNKQDQKLLDAVEKGDVGKVSLLMSKKTARPTKPNALGQTAFHLAASKGLTECLTVLLNHGADANAKNDDGSTALHLATISCQPQCVKVLLQHGANEDCLDGGNWTPLHWAALSGCASSVLLLCDQEASLDVTDNNGRTPLMVAAQVKQPAVCSQLLQRGATVDLTDRDGKTALMIACESGSTESVELLLQSGADVARVDRAGRDALHYAKRAKDRALRRLVRNALRKQKKRGQGQDPSSEASSQVPSESERETNGSSLTLQSERRDPSDGEEEEEEEGSELKEWRIRYREEKMKVIQLELQLSQKEKECEALSDGCKAMTERVWDQVQEISQLLPEGDDRAQGWKALSQRYSRDSTEEDYFLNLLAEQVQELKRRRQKLEMREKQVSQKLETQEEKCIHIGTPAGRDALHYAKRAKDRALRRLVRNALRKQKKREQGQDPSSEASSQVPSESERETNGSSLTLQSERRDPSDGEEEEEEEGSELKEWRIRYREEKMKVIQLELQLSQKEKECEALSDGCKAMTERVWDQVQEISQLLPEGDDRAQGWKALSRRYSRDSTEEDYFLNLLAEQVQELKRRRQKLEMREKQVSQKLETQEEKAAAVQAETEVRWPGEEEEEEQKRQQAELKRLQAEVAAALEEKASADKRVQEMEGHMENMRAVIGVYEAKRKNQSRALKELEARVKELGGENQRLRGLLAKRPAGKPESALATEKLCQFLADMEKVSDEVQKENGVVMAENVALKREAEEALGSKLQRQAVPSGAVRRGVLAWKKVTEGLERALIRLGQVNATFLEKGRALREALLAPSAGAMVNGDGPLVGEKGTLREEVKPSPGNPKIPEESRKVRMGKDHVPNGPVGQVKLRRKPEPAEEKAGPCRKSSDLEKEVWDLKKSNETLAKELAQLSREREKLQEELQRLCSPKEETSQAEGTKNAVEELERTVDSLTQQLSAEKEEARKLQLKLEVQKEEMEAVKGGFLKEASKEANSFGVGNLDSCILKELHWKLDNVVKKQNEALQLVSEMEEENHSLEAEQNGLGTFPREKKPQLDVSLEAADAAGDNVKVRQRMSELEKGLEDAKEALEADEASPGISGRGAGKLKQLLDQLGAKMAELRHEEEEALKKHEKVRGMLSVRAQALGSELASLLEKYEEARGECVLHRDALAAEKRKNEELRGEAAEHEEEVEELRGKSQMMENAVEKLHKKVEDLTKACQDREAKIKKLLKETEKLSSEVLNLRSERARLQLHIEMVQKNHQEIVTIYRTHLLNAAQGFMDEEVHSMLLQILQTNS